MSNLSKIQGAYLYKDGRVYGRLSIKRSIVFICSDDPALAGTRLDDTLGYKYSHSFSSFCEYSKLKGLIQYTEHRFRCRVILSDSLTLYDLI